MTEYTINGRPATVEEVKSRMAYDEAQEIRRELRDMAAEAAGYKYKGVSITELDKEELLGACVGFWKLTL